MASDSGGFILVQLKSYQKFFPGPACIMDSDDEEEDEGRRETARASDWSCYGILDQ